MKLRLSSGVAAVMLIAASNCHAETALESIARASKNPLVKSAPAALPPTPKEQAAGSEKVKASAARLDERRVAPPEDSKPAYVQRVDEIIVEAQREPEDIKPLQKLPFQKMKEKLDGVGKSLPMAVVETQSNGGNRTAVFKRNGTCYSIKNNAGRMNNDGSMGSSGRDAMTCSPIEAASK